MISRDVNGERACGIGRKSSVSSFVARDVGVFGRDKR